MHALVCVCVCVCVTCMQTSRKGRRDRRTEKRKQWGKLERKSKLCVNSAEMPHVLFQICFIWLRHKGRVKPSESCEILQGDLRQNHRLNILWYSTFLITSCLASNCSNGNSDFREKRADETLNSARYKCEAGAHLHRCTQQVLNLVGRQAGEACNLRATVSNTRKNQGCSLTVPLCIDSFLTYGHQSKRIETAETGDGSEWCPTLFFYALAVVPVLRILSTACPLGFLLICVLVREQERH